MGHVEDLWKENYKKNLESDVFNRSYIRPVKALVVSNSIYRKPVILVGAGPSLDKNIDILAKNQDKFIILCADVVAYRLIEEGITPDFICSIDPHPSICRFWKGLDTKKLKLIAPTTTSPESLDIWQGDIYLFNQADNTSKEKGELLYNLTKPTHTYGFINNMFFVGATLLQVSTIFKPSHIYIIGLDFGFTDNKAYCKGFLDKKLVDENNVGMDVLQERELFSDAEVNGIKTTKLFILYKDTFLKLVNYLISSTNTVVVNCTEGGILTEILAVPLSSAASAHNEIINKSLVGQLKKRARKKKR